VFITQYFLIVNLFYVNIYKFKNYLFILICTRLYYLLNYIICLIIVYVK